jgi:hypothetical protein
MAGISIGGGSIEPRNLTGGASDTAGPAILPSGGDGLGVTFQIGGIQIRGRLPLIPRALELVSASGVAYTLAADTDNGTEVVLIRSAAIGFCWRGIGLSVGDFRRDFRRDVVDYGEAVQHALLKKGIPFAEINAVGEELVAKIFASIPTQDEVDEKREDFMDPRPGSSDEEPAAAGNIDTE